MKTEGILMLIVGGFTALGGCILISYQFYNPVNVLEGAVLAALGFVFVRIGWEMVK